MPAQQFVVQLPNKPGALASLLEAFASRGLDLRSIGGSGIGTQGAAVLVLNDATAAREVLNAGKYTFIEAEALVTSAPDQPGAVASIARRLANAGVDDPELARRVLATSTPGGSVI
jgi:hypothetical protein